ncbi:hypothetical protein ACFX1T_013291 [Malus domestica]
MAQSMQIKDKRVDELEKQVGQIAEFVGQFQEQGKLPSSTVANPRGGFETAKAIMLRSGKEVGTDPQPSKYVPKEDKKLQIEEEDHAKATARIEQSLPQPPTPSPHPNPSKSGKKGPIPISSNVIPPNVPFPSRFLQAKNEEEEKDILETFRKVHVNIPLLDAIKQIPKYAKFFKKLCTTKKRFQEKEVVHVSENVSAMLQRKLPPKCKDPSSFTIPCVIGNTRFDFTMLHLGASKKRFREKEVVHESENVSTMLQRKLPPKCKDPGSFTIPCVIGNTRFDFIMLDLGALIGAYLCALLS